MIDFKTKVVATLYGGLLIMGNILGGFDTYLKVMLTMIVVDFITGTFIAMSRSRIKSKVAYRGVLKKSMYLVMVLIGTQLDLVTGQTLFRSMIVLYIICVEVISLLEHMDTLDVPYPKFIRVFLDKLMGDIDNTTLSNEWKPDPKTIERIDDQL